MEWHRKYNATQVMAWDIITLTRPETSCLIKPPSILRVVKSRRLENGMRVFNMGKMRNAYRILSGKPLGNIHLEDRGDGKTRLRWIEGILDERRGEDENNSGSCAMMGFGIEDAEPRQGDGKAD